MSGMENGLKQASKTSKHPGGHDHNNDDPKSLGKELKRIERDMDRSEHAILNLESRQKRLDHDTNRLEKDVKKLYASLPKSLAPVTGSEIESIFKRPVADPTTHLLVERREAATKISFDKLSLSGKTFDGFNTTTDIGAVQFEKASKELIAKDPHAAYVLHIGKADRTLDDKRTIVLDKNGKILSQEGTRTTPDFSNAGKGSGDVEHPSPKLPDKVENLQKLSQSRVDEIVHEASGTVAREKMQIHEYHLSK